MSNKIELLEGKRLKSAIKGWKNRAESWTARVASIGSSVVYHAAVHGDVTLLNRFFEHLPSSYTSPFKRWLQAKGAAEFLNFKKGVFSLKKESKEAREKFAKNFKPENWTDFRVKRETEWDEEALLKSLFNLEKKAADLNVPEGVLRHLNEAATIVDGIVKARKEGELKKAA